MVSYKLANLHSKQIEKKSVVCSCLAWILSLEPRAECSGCMVKRRMLNTNMGVFGKRLNR